MSEDLRSGIRLSQDQINSNPILHSQRVFRTGNGRREQERLQLKFLLQHQKSGGAVFTMPEFIRVDSAELTLSNERVGVVGLVVDDEGVGYVTRLTASQNSTWEVSVDLPFHYSHIQKLLLRVIGDERIDGGLPELLAFKIDDTLKQRCEGDSMDVAALLAVVDAAAGKPFILDATAAVVSPFGTGSLRASKSTAQKLRAFIREFGSGSLLVRHPEDHEAAEFDSYFDNKWVLSTLGELAEKLETHELLTPLIGSFQLSAVHGPAIGVWLQHLLVSESRHVEGTRFVQRLKQRLNASTPLRLRQEIAYAEEDLFRHLGDFDKAISVRTERIKLEEDTSIACYERSASSDNRHAAALYDAHRMREGVEFLWNWNEKFKQDHRICLPETRAILKNTLARCLAALGEDGWEELLEESLEIQKATDPASVPRTKNVLVHSLLKANKFPEAAEILDVAGEPKDFFDLWLHAETARQAELTWNEDKCSQILEFDTRDHAFGFICQAIARQLGHDQNTRVEYLTRAKQSFSIGAEHDATNIKRLLSEFCSLAISVSSGTEDVEAGLNEIRQLLRLPGLSGARTWYERDLKHLEQTATWEAVDRLFCRVPHF